LQQLQDDILHIFADVSGLGKRSRIHDSKRHVQDLRQGLCHQRLPGARRADQKDVRLLKLHLTVSHPVHVDAFAVVVNRYLQLLFDGFLADHVLVQELLDFERLRNFVGGAGRGLDLVVLKNRVANGNALIADIRTGVIAGGRDELSDYVLALMTKRTSQSIIGSGTLPAVFSPSAADMDWDATMLPPPPG